MSSTMKQFWMKYKSIFGYLFLFIFLLTVYSVWIHVPIKNEQKTACLLMRYLLGITTFLSIIYLIIKKNLSTNFLNFIIIDGIIMRIGYTLYTPFYIRSHDLGMITQSDSLGHINYIYYFYKHFSLPDTYFGQFYHPPFFHFVAACVMRIFHFLFPSIPLAQLVDVTKLVSCFSSIGSLFVIKKILQKLNAGSITSTITMLITAFFPNFYLTAGRVNNDSLAFFFLLLSLYYFILWGQSKKLSNLIYFAISLGFGMMTKLSVSIVAILAAPYMLYHLYSQYKAGKLLQIIKQYIIFLCVCAPIGLWHSLRNLIVLGQPLGYVLNIEVYGLTTMYRGNMSIFRRFISFPYNEIISSPYIDVHTDYNTNAYLLRSSLFGEFPFSGLENNAIHFIQINLFLIIMSLLAVVAILFIKQKNYWLRFGPACVWSAIMISYYSFNIKFPQSCTMDYRYVLISSICGSIYIGQLYEWLISKSHSFFEKKHTLLHFKILHCIVIGFLLLPVIYFCFLSSYFYTSIK